MSLGDFACAKKASKGIMAGAVRCVAAWAVEACPVVKCLWREEKQSGTHVREPRIDLTSFWFIELPYIHVKCGACIKVAPDIGVRVRRRTTQKGRLKTCTVVLRPGDGSRSRASAAFGGGDFPALGVDVPAAASVLPRL